MDAGLSTAVNGVVMLGTHGKLASAITNAAVEGWCASGEHQIERALAAYHEVDQLLPSGSMNAELSVLRHNVGAAHGAVLAIPPTEDRVISFVMPEHVLESQHAIGLNECRIDALGLERGIRGFISGYDPGYHKQNLVRDLPHVLTLSTGRCGTVSLYRLFDGSRLIPYHTYWWTLPVSARWEMMCRMTAGEFASYIPDLWAAARAAEWLGAMAQGKPMIGLNHTDTIFAPVFAAIHPSARFIHLRRDPEAVFDSFYGKNQWSETQLRPMCFVLDPDFRFKRTDDDLVSCLAWYVHFTETFARAMGRVIGPERYIEISSDRLFARDSDEIDQLLFFLRPSGIDIEEARKHFATKINEKAHKARYALREMDVARAAFSEALAALRSG